MRHLIKLSIVLSLLLSLPSPAKANDFIIDRGSARHPDSALSLTLSTWWHGVGGALWYAIPVAPKGFLPHVNDSFAIEFGSFLYAYNDASQTHFALLPLAGVRWNFHLTPMWTAFATAKLGVLAIFDDAYARPEGGLTVGSLLHVSKKADLRFELGYPGGFQFGVHFPL